MARRDLTQEELRELQAEAARTLPARPMDMLNRLIGEVLELRNREAHARQLHDLEGEY